MTTGSVRLFSRSGTAWTHEAQLLPSNPGSGGFGKSTAIAGDGSLPPPQSTSVS